jgi:Protein of unknown function (DUF3019)
MSGGGVAVCAAFCVLASGAAGAAPAAAPDSIELEVRPRVCTLSAGDSGCDTVVEAQWRSSRPESLCLLIVGRPEIRQCWEDHSQGRYTVSLVFSEDLLVELRDLELRNVLASQAIRVIREALQLRRKRRPPWSIFP